MQRFLTLSATVIVAITLSACTSSYTGYGQTRKNNLNLSESNDNVTLGVKLLKKNQVALAKSRFLAAVQEDPKSPASWYSLAYFYEATGNEQLAAQYYKKAIQVAPRSGMAHNNYGTYLCRHKKYVKAVRQFMLAIRQPDYIDTAQAYENAGICALMIPNQNWAMTYFQRALENRPTLATSNLELAKLYFKQGNKPMAQYYFSQFKKYSKPTAESRVFAKKLKA